MVVSKCLSQLNLTRDGRDSERLATQKAILMHGNRHAASKRTKAEGSASEVHSWAGQAQTVAGVGCRCKSR